MKRKIDVAIIGGGPAGLAAALKASEAGAKVLVLERDISRAASCSSASITASACIISAKS